MRILSLDPSVNNVGWSVLNTKAKNKKQAWKWGTFKIEGNNLEMRIMDLIQLIDDEIGEFHILITEKPTFFSSEKGHIAAHLNYTIDLAAICYGVAGWFHMDHRTHFAITATQWKGQVSKAITARRFFRQFPEVNPDTLSEHAIDSIMLCRFAVEQFILWLPDHRLDRTKAEIKALL